MRKEKTSDESAMIRQPAFSLFWKLGQKTSTSSFSLVALIHRIESPPTSFPILRLFPPPFYAFSLFLFLYSLVFRSSFSLVSLGSWLDDEPTRRERERENGHLVSLYKYQVLFSLSLSLSCERSLTFFFPYSPSEIVTKRRWENPSSNKFLLHILYIIEED